MMMVLHVQLSNLIRGCKFSLGPFISLDAQPDLPLAYKTGKSNCSSFASKTYK